MQPAPGGVSGTILSYMDLGPARSEIGGVGVHVAQLVKIFNCCRSVVDDEFPRTRHTLRVAEVLSILSLRGSQQGAPNTVAACNTGATKDYESHRPEAAFPTSE